MPDLTNRELDELFREGADLQEFSYNEAAWEDVDRRLNKEDRRRKFIIIILVLLAAVILGFFARFTFSSGQNPEVIVEDVTLETTKNEDLNLIIPSNEDSKFIDSINYNGNTVQTNVTSTKIYNNSENERLTSTSKDDLRLESIEKQSIEKILKESIGADSKRIVNEKNIPENYADSSNKLGNLNVDFESRRSNKNESSDGEDYTRIKQSTFNLDQSEIEQLLISIQRKSLVLSEKPLKARATHGLIVALAANAEWSSVDMEPFGKLGHKLEGRIGYQFAKRFELSTGVAYAKKMFQTGGETFQADERIWTDNIVPETMYGEDDVIEIPIDFSYYHRGYSNSGIFTSIGLRSYMMHKETFNFEYGPLEPRPDLIQSYTMIEEHEHWFGILRFSAGYQFRINKFQSIQLSPYVQVPFTEIGHGNQKLYSAGIQIASRFNLR